MPEDSSSPESAAIFQDAHPLAHRLIERLGAQAGTIVIVGDGRGRNSRALRNAGLHVVAVGDEAPYTQLAAAPRTFDGALSTHAYLHGTSAKVRAGIAELARVLRGGAPAFLTFGSIRDVRFGYGEALDEHTFAPGEGPEKGVPHAYFDRDAILDVLRPFAVVHVEEVEVDNIVGKWAHLGDEPAGKIHWFAEVRKV